MSQDRAVSVTQRGCKVSKGTTKVKEDDDGEEARGSREKYVIGDFSKGGLYFFCKICTL